MKKTILILSVILLLASNIFAQENIKTFPENGLMYFYGLDDTSSPPSVKDGRASDIQNITLDTTGAATKRNGYKIKNTYLDTIKNGDDFEAIVGLYELYKSSGTRYLIAVNGIRQYYDNSGTWTNVSGNFLTEGQNNQFVWTTALDYAIGSNNVNPPIKWNGTGNFSNLLFTGLTNAVTKARCLVWWKNYLILGNTVEAGTSHTTRIRWSNVGTVETWTDADYIDIASLGGQQIEAFGILYDNLYIFLTDSIYKVSLVGGDELLLVTKVSEGIGCIAKNSVQNVQIGNSEGLIFLSRDKTINFCNGVNVTEISGNISNLMDDLSASRLPYAVSIDDQLNSHYYLAVTTGTSGTTNNLLLDFHYGLGEWSQHTQIDTNAMCIANNSDSDPVVFFGNYDSMVFELSDPDLDSDVVGLTGTVDRTGYSNFSTATGIMIIVDNSQNFSTATGAIIRITAGTGLSQESVIFHGTATGVCAIVTPFTTVPNTTSTYSVGDIDAYYTTKWYDLGVIPLRKNFAELFFWATTQSNVTMDITYATDFAATLTTSNVDLYADGSLWGTAIWGTDTWGGTEASLTRVPLNVSGRFIKFRFREQSIDEPMELFGYSIAYWGLDIF